MSDIHVNMIIESRDAVFFEDIFMYKREEEKMWRPDPAGTETPLRRIYAGRKYPHVYTLSISTGKNQSAEAQW